MGFDPGGKGFTYMLIHCQIMLGTEDIDLNEILKSVSDLFKKLTINNLLIFTTSSIQQHFKILCTNIFNQLQILRDYFTNED